MSVAALTLQWQDALCTCLSSRTLAGYRRSIKGSAKEAERRTPPVCLLLLLPLVSILEQLEVSRNE